MDSKQRARWFSLLLHPLILALPIAVGIILLLPAFPKYTLEVISSQADQDEVLFLCDDLDGNGYGDRLAMDNTDIGGCRITIMFYPERYVQEWNFHGQPDFYSNEYLMTGDADGDGKQEVYIFTVSSDSVLLHMIIDYSSPDAELTNRFISTVRLIDGQYDLAVVPGIMDDLTGDGVKELIFGLNAGYSGYPRHVYAYDIVNDSLMISPESSAQFSRIDQVDVTGDGLLEVIPQGYATQNACDSGTVYPDCSCWLMVLDRNLQFLFDPVEFPGIYGDLYKVVVPMASGKPVLIGIRIPPSWGYRAPILIRFDQEGKVMAVDSAIGIVSEDIVFPFSFQDRQDGLWYISTGTGMIRSYDTLLQLVENKQIPYNLDIGLRKWLDVDRDGVKECVVYDLNQQLLAVFRSDLSNPAIVPVKISSEPYYRVSYRLRGEDIPWICVDGGDRVYFLAYGLNLHFYLRWLYYAGIYLGIWLFILIISKIQRVQLEKQFKTEKKITELQLMLVRNQLDPHFTFNTINAIGAAVMQEDKDIAYKKIVNLGRLMRFSISDANKISRSLGEELAFVRDYLDLISDRFTHPFSSNLDLDPNVDLTLQIPKMLVQIHVENAVKHGIRPLDKPGTIDIGVTQQEGGIRLSIRDNGIGREAAKNKGTTGTGKGLTVMDDYLALFEKVTKMRIEIKIMDLKDDLHQPIGTRVMIMIMTK